MDAKIKKIQRELASLLKADQKRDKKMKKCPSKMKKQGYNDKLDESLGIRMGKESTKSQSYKSRRDESRGAKKKK